MFTTPVSVNDGFKRADSRTWIVLAICAVAAIVIVAVLALFVDKPQVKWPSSGPQQPAATQTNEAEPRTYDVAPPGSVPPPSSSDSED